MTKSKTAVSGKINVPKIARLANLPLADKDISVFTLQIIDILNYVEQIRKIDTSNIKPTFNLSTNKKTFRKDTSKLCLDNKKAIANAQFSNNGYILTKGIFENG